MVRLVRAVRRHAEIVRLFLRELGQLHADFFEVLVRDFFVEFLGQTFGTILKILLTGKCQLWIALPFLIIWRSENVRPAST